MHCRPRGHPRHDSSAPEDQLTVRQQLVRTSIEGYLDNVGVIFEPDDLPTWFYWVQTTEPRVFIARCGDPPPPTAPDDGYQPWNYFIEVELEQYPDRSIQSATAVDFHHDSQLVQAIATWDAGGRP